MRSSVAGLVISALWITWFLIWLVASRNVKETRWKEPLSSGLKHRVPLIIGMLPIGSRGLWPAFLRARFVPNSPIVNAIGVAFAFIAFVDKEPDRGGPYARDFPGV